MIDKTFLENVIINESDEKNAEIFLCSKGFVKHSLIKNYLLSRSDTNTVEYTAIATTYRYDKRVRNILFKYISYLEEFYRGKILDLYYYNTDQTFWTSKVKYWLGKYENDLDRALEKIEFSELINQIKKIKELSSEVFPKIPHLNDNLSGLIDLRNAVMHNKLLILFNDYKICFDENGLDSATLTSNIKNLVVFLPSGPKEKCIKEINDCAIDGNENNDTKWNLPQFVVVKI